MYKTIRVPFFPTDKEYLAERVLLGLNGIASVIFDTDAVVTDIGIEVGSADSRSVECIVGYVRSPEKEHQIMLLRGAAQRFSTHHWDISFHVRKGGELFVDMNPFPKENGFITLTWSPVVEPVSCRLPGDRGPVAPGHKNGG